MLNSDLIKILSEVRNLLDSPETDIAWSRWESIEDALNEIDCYMEKVIQGDKSVIPDLRFLFAPTGSLQEVSINSGWEWTFIDLSTRFDRVIGDK